MLSKEQEEKLIKLIPTGTTGENRRAAYSVIAGVREDKTPQHIAGYYTVEISLVNEWFEFFGFNSPSSSAVKSKGRKGKDLNSYVKTNIGRTVTPKIVVDEIGISLPTFYNYYNANRHLFKKVKRGEFQIVDPAKVRAEQK